MVRTRVFSEGEMFNELIVGGWVIYLANYKVEEELLKDQWDNKLERYVKKMVKQIVVRSRVIGVMERSGELVYVIENTFKDRMITKYINELYNHSNRYSYKTRTVTQEELDSVLDAITAQIYRGIINFTGSNYLYNPMDSKFEVVLNRGRSIRIEMPGILIEYWYHGTQRYGDYRLSNVTIVGRGRMWGFSERDMDRLSEALCCW